MPSFAPMLAAMWARVARSSLRARLVGAAGGTLVGGAAIAASVQLQTPAACQERQSGMQTTPGAIGQERRSGMQRRASVDSHIRSGERLRVAVYGGSFNPITNAHLNCAAELIHSRLVDEVWMVPCGPRPDKPSLKTSALHRLIMCHLAVDTTFGSRFGVRVIEECTSCLRDMPSLVLMCVALRRLCCTLTLSARLPKRTPCAAPPEFHQSCLARLVRLSRPQAALQGALPAV